MKTPDSNIQHRCIDFYIDSLTAVRRFTSSGSSKRIYRKDGEEYQSGKDQSLQRTTKIGAGRQQIDVCVCVWDSRRCAGSLAGSSSIRLAGLAAGAWTGEEVEFGSGLAEGLKELLSCYEHTETQSRAHTAPQRSSPGLQRPAPSPALTSPLAAPAPPPRLAAAWAFFLVRFFNEFGGNAGAESLLNHKSPDSSRALQTWNLFKFFFLLIITPWSVDKERDLGKGRPGSSLPNIDAVTALLAPLAP